MADRIRICFVCLGNICRSPTAEAVMQRLVDDAGLTDHVEVASAGTAGWHIGDAPDDRAVAEARRRGIEMTSRGRQFRGADFERFELVVAMDRSNHQVLADLAQRNGDDQATKVRMLREFASTSPGLHDVPDPYYGGDDGFATVFDMVEDACRNLLDHVRQQHHLP
jgi:protein-tyrosine phosphatase